MNELKLAYNFIFLKNVKGAASNFIFRNFRKENKDQPIYRYINKLYWSFGCGGEPTDKKYKDKNVEAKNKLGKMKENI